MARRWQRTLLSRAHGNSDCGSGQYRRNFFNGLAYAAVSVSRAGGDLFQAASRGDAPRLLFQNIALFAWLRLAVALLEKKPLPLVMPNWKRLGKALRTGG